MLIADMRDLPPDFKFEYWYWAQVVKIYDGDSITLHIDQGMRTWRHDEKIRFMSIDAPEIRGEERPAGLIAKGALEEKIPVGTWLRINTYLDKSGKYGRLLVVIYKELENINLWMYNNGYAVPYMEMKQ